MSGNRQKRHSIGVFAFLHDIGPVVASTHWRSIL